MKAFTNLRSRTWLGIACSIALAGCVTRPVVDPVAQEQSDHTQILNLITHYYYNFGKESPENFSDFYADDAELILGDRHYKGKEGVMQAYGRAPAAAAAPAAGATPAVAAAPARERPKRYTFNVTISNPLIIVHGDTATSQVIFTEYVQEKKEDPTKMTTQGKEYGTFVKVKGQWRYKTRQIAGGSEPPAGWKE